MSEPVETVARLYQLVARPFRHQKRRKLVRLEPHGESLVFLSRLAAVASRRVDGELDMALRVGAARCVGRLDASTLILPDDLALGARQLGSNIAATGQFGALFSVPGIRETLHVNGRARAATEAELATVFSEPPAGGLRLDVVEVVSDRPEALVRSELWRAIPTVAPAPRPDRAADEAAFLARSPFALLATCSLGGELDVSPRGDPPGFIRRLADDRLLVLDSPGDQSIDSLSNVVVHPQVALACLVPGEARVLLVRGHARLSVDSGLLRTAVTGDRPLVAMHVDVAESELVEVAAFERERLWDPSTYVDTMMKAPLAFAAVDPARRSDRDAATADAAQGEDGRCSSVRTVPSSPPTRPRDTGGPE